MESKELENLLMLLKNKLHEKKLYKITILAEIMKFPDYEKLSEQGVIELFDDACLLNEQSELRSELVVPLLYKIYLSSAATRFNQLQPQQKIDCVRTLTDSFVSRSVENLDLRLKNHYLLVS